LLDTSNIHNFHCSSTRRNTHIMHPSSTFPISQPFIRRAKYVCKDVRRREPKCKSPHQLSTDMCLHANIYLYLLVASIALSRPTILRLLPRPNFPLIRPAAGINVSSQCLNTAFMSLGTPSMTTVVTGMNGLSSSETARMLYSCAKRRAVAKAWDCVRDKEPMILSMLAFPCSIVWAR
jgi:hypothetical protein